MKTPRQIAAERRADSLYASLESALEDIEKLKKDIDHKDRLLTLTQAAAATAQENAEKTFKMVEARDADIVRMAESSTARIRDVIKERDDARGEALKASRLVTSLKAELIETHRQIGYLDGYVDALKGNPHKEPPAKPAMPTRRDIIDEEIPF